MENEAIAVDQQTELAGVRVAGTVQSDVKVASNVDWFNVDGHAIENGGQLVVK
jgi:hypothetical protein